jgi:hypothetical protein
MRGSELLLMESHSSCYDYIIIAAAMAHKHRNCAKMPKTQRGDFFGLEVGFLAEYE